MNSKRLSANSEWNKQKYKKERERDKWNKDESTIYRRKA
jgi:hypothetical protein